MKILVVEDNPQILQNIVDYLSLKGFEADPIQNGLGALHLATTQEYDLIILDINLPGMDGIALCRTLRKNHHSRVPIIMLTARDSLDDKRVGFDEGADDYIVKPFALPELLYRIEAIMRRVKPVQDELKVDTLVMDVKQMTVHREGIPISLNKKCMELLKLLMENSPSVLTKTRLEDAVWARDLPDSHSLKSHIYMLRNAIDKPFTYPLLHTVHGTGYKLSRETDSI